MRRNKFFWNLYSTYLFVTVGCLLLISWITTVTLQKFYLEQTRIALETQGQLIIRILENEPIINQQNYSIKLSSLTELSNSRLTLIGADGTILGDTEKDPSSMDNHKDRIEVLEALTGHTGTSTRYSNTIETEMIYVSIPVKKSGKITYILRVSVPITSIKTALKTVQSNIFTGGILIALVIMMVSLFFSRQISNPLEAMRKGAERIAGGDFGVRIASEGSIETRSLADALNKMAGELKQKMDTIQRQQSENDAVFRSMQEAVIAVDNNRSILLLNPYAAGLFEIDNRTAAGKNVLNLIRNTKLHDCLAKVLGGEDMPEATFTFEGERRQRVLRARGTCLKNNRNEIIGALVVMSDITQIKKLETMRRDFVANVSHELKTPIASIKGAAETLLDGALQNPADARKFVEMIFSNGERLNRIVGDLLSLSKIEQGAESGSIKMEVFKLKGIINEAVKACEMRSVEKIVSIVQEVPEDLRVAAEPQMLEQAIINLLDNAIKYSGAGAKVNIKAEQRGNETYIMVADNGPGIPSEHLPRLFERFYRADKARSRNLGGTGLGLAIVKHIVQTHEGSVTVESILGKGSCFTIRLPGVRKNNYPVNT